MSWQVVHDDPLARGRARVERAPGGAKIVIPAKREWPLLFFLLFWLGAWTAGGAGVIAGLVGGDTDGAGAAFSVFWLGGWLLGWCFAASVLVWALFGREVVDVDGGGLTVTRAAGPYRRVKRFTRERIGAVGTEPYQGLLRGLRGASGSWQQGMEIWGIGGGSIRLDYGARTHRFGSKLDDPESRQLADLIARELRLEQAEAARTGQ